MQPADPQALQAEALAFLQIHLRSLADWPPGLLLPWFTWHWRNGGVGIVRHQGRVRAVAVARCVASIAEAQEHAYAHHEDPESGRILWCDQLASEHPLGLSILLAQARLRFGPRATVAGDVFKRPGELRMLPWSRVEKLLHHHGLT